MKNNMSAVLAVMACGCLASCSVFGGNSALNIHGGTRSLSNDFDNVSDQSVGGAELVVGLGDGGWAVEAQGFYAENSEASSVNSSDSTVVTKELAFGARRTFFQNSPVRPYFGLGANWMDAELKNGGFDNLTDDGFGGYAHVGVLAALFAFQVGIDLRGGLTSAELAGESLDYTQATIFLGLTW